jgi:hypothetical protein
MTKNEQLDFILDKLKKEHSFYRRNKWMEMQKNLNEKEKIPEKWNDFILLTEKLDNDDYARIKDDILTLTEQGQDFEGYVKMESRKASFIMYSLFKQGTDTGDKIVDEKINHAIELFLKPKSTMAEKRSACENLSFVLEPLKEEITIIFSSKDKNDFFILVNNFNIRHNNEITQKNIHEEKLEWIFYTLLNTINTYYKLKKKLNLNSNKKS